MYKRFTEKENILKYLELINDGKLAHIDGGIYRIYKRLNGTKEIKLAKPERASSANVRGYMRLSFDENKRRFHAYEHRLIYALHYGLEELYRHECIDHIDGNKSNNRIENLRGLSIRENTLQAESLGLYKRTYGELNGMHKLKDGEVSEIRDLYANKVMNQYEIGKVYNISQGYVSNLVNNKGRIQSAGMTLRSKY